LGDDAVSLLNFRAGQMVTIKRPEPGTWTLRIAGSGIAAVVVQAQSSLGIAPPEFAPVSATSFSPVPSARRENVVRIRVNGRASALHATLVTGELLQLAELPLSTADTESTYLSRFTPGAQGFRVLLSGRDGNGFPFQRMSAPLLRAAAPGAAPK
jgi:hypothetical protein